MSTALSLARKAAVETFTRELARAARSAGVECMPISNADTAARGANRGFAMGSSQPRGAKRGRGLLVKVQHSTVATKFGGGSAAMEIAIGPENDSPSKAKGSEAGRLLRTSASSSW